MLENTTSKATPSPEPARSGEAKVKQQAEAVAKSKSDERREHLEQFRAAQAEKRAKALGLKPDATTAKPPQGSRPLLGQHSVVEPRRAASIPRTPRPPSPPRSASVGPEVVSRNRASLTKPPRAVSAAKSSTQAPGTAPRPSSKPLPKVLSSRKKPSPAEVAASETKQGSQWAEGQQAFGFEAAKPTERRASSTGHTSAAGLPAALADDGDPLSGIRWQVQLERLQLQQWQILNGRMAASMEAQRLQAEQQISQAAEAVVALKQKLAKEKARRAIEQTEQHAAAALAAQLPRLELYSEIKEEHEQSLQDITEAVAKSLQHMPLVNGATCGGADLEEVEPEKLSAALRSIENVMNNIIPRIKPFLGDTPSSPTVAGSNLGEGAVENGKSGLQLTANTAETLADVDGQLRMLLEGNSGLLRQVEQEVVHAESLAVQFLQAESGK